MSRSTLPRHHRLPQRAAVVVAFLLALSGCSSDSGGDGASVLMADGLTCDQDVTTAVAQDSVERAGGLRNDDFSVRFATSTRLGVVTLVSGDLPKAFDQLTDSYGVSLVATYEEDDSGRVIGFEQVRQLVDEVCPPAA